MAHRPGQAAERANTAGWEQFGDPVPNQLIERALQGSPDLLCR